MPYWLKPTHLFEVLNRRWRTIAIVCAIALFIALFTYRTTPELYQVQLRYIVGQAPLPTTGNTSAEDGETVDWPLADEDVPNITSERERYYRWVASEYEVFGMVDYMNGTLFAQRVTEQLLATHGIEMDVAEVDEDIFAEATRSRLLVRMVEGDRDYLDALAQSVIAVITNETNNPQIPQFGDSPANLFLIDIGLIEKFNQTAFAQQMGLPMRLLLSVLSGFVVAALIEVLDPTIRHRDAVASKFKVLGEIPQA